MTDGKQAGRETKASDRQQRPPAQAEQLPALPETAAFERARQSAPPDLPTESNARSLRQASLLQRQRTAGNRHARRFAPQPVPQPAPIQRAGPGANVEVGSGGVKVELSADFSKKFPMKYAVGVITPKTAVMGELKPVAEPPAAGSVNKGGAKLSVNVYKDQAAAAGSSKFGGLVYNQLGQDGWKIQKVDWESELGVGETESGGGTAAVATGVKFTFENGHEAVAKAQLFENSSESGMSGPKLSVEPVLKLPEAVLWDNGIARLTAGGEFKLELALEPNWSEIFKELARSGSRTVARQFARAALRGAVNTLLGPGGFIAGGVITIFAASMSMIDIGEIEECKQQARSAVRGYVQGWCASWGIDQFGTDGLDPFFYKGIDDGRAKLAATVREIQQHPVFAAWNFTADELRPALKAQLREHAGQVYNQVLGEVKVPIYTEFVRTFYQRQKSSFFRPDYIARQNAVWVARGLGLSNPESILPPA